MDFKEAISAGRTYSFFYNMNITFNYNNVQYTAFAEKVVGNPVQYRVHNFSPLGLPVHAVVVTVDNSFKVLHASNHIQPSDALVQTIAAAIAQLK